MNQQPIYDPAKTYAYNFKKGPFGEFAMPTRYHNKGAMPFTFLGRPIFSPFGIPAGPLLNAKYVAAALAKGFDVVVYKTQRSAKFEPNKFPNVLYVDVDGDLTLEKAAHPLVGHTTTHRPPTELTITNSFGMPSGGPDFWLTDFRHALAAQGRGQLVILSVVGTIRPGFSQDDYYNDFAATAKLGADAGASVIEVNLSCPNVANEGVICYTPPAVAEICRRVKAAVGSVPLITKIGYYTPQQQALLETVVKEMAPYVDAISAINTIAAPIVDEHGEQALPGPNRLRSGMCGAGIKWAGLDMVRRLAALRTKLGLSYEIVGVGGVMTPADYRQYRDAGADLVQSATGAMWNPDLAIDIKAAGL
ncbi:MAG TPA: diguanylate cyclase [Candidatus Saccharimonadia bacterium]|nr:diguanylate cyclase [Candidatus Saccharimonadia bacterium]